VLKRIFNHKRENEESGENYTVRIFVINALSKVLIGK
jgi:hypothetical protein